MKCLVTGGAGFIGSHLVEELVRQKNKVVVLDNLSTGNLNNLKLVKKKIKFLKYDISKKKNILKRLKGIKYIFHLAGLSNTIESTRNPKKYYKTNVDGTINILEICKELKVKKFVYSASASCYGNSKELPTSENAKIQALSPYAKTKWFAEQIIMLLANKKNMPAISLRFFNVYGPRSKANNAYSAVISIFLKQTQANKPLTVVGNGQQTRSFVHVYDVVDALIKASKSKVKNEIFNVGSKRSYKIIEIAKLFSKKKTYIAKRPGEAKYSSANIQKIIKKLKWHPKVTLNKGIKMLLKSEKSSRKYLNKI